MTALLNGQAVKTGLASTKVTTSRGSARCSSRAPAPAVETAPRLRSQTRSAETSVASSGSSLRREPKGDGPDFIVGKPLGDASHHGRRAPSRAKGLHRHDDLTWVA